MTYPYERPLSPEREERDSRLKAANRDLRGIYARAKLNRFVVNEKLLLRHVLLVGSSGSGKTNHAFNLIMQAARFTEPCSCIVLDVKKEYSRLSKMLPHVQVFSIGGEPRFRFNPLIPPPGVDEQHHDRALTEVFTRAYGLAEPSRRIMLDALSELRRRSKESPTLRELELAVAGFESGSPKEQGSKRSLESRLHIINTGPLGESLNCEEALDIGLLDDGVCVFEIGEVDSLRDQRFVAELLLMYIWQHDRYDVDEDPENFRRLVVVEEAHRYLSEERPPEQRGDRTLLELAIAEARRYGWGFVIIDQMPMLLSRYVWDNVGTVITHRLSNIDSYKVVRRAIGEIPMGQNMDDERLAPLIFRLPENLAMYRKYVGEDSMELPSGFVEVPFASPDAPSTEKSTI
jgi:DNA helicase HerA-like ATPase